MKTVSSLIKASPLPKVETRVLLQAVLNVNHAWLISHADQLVTEPQANEFITLMNRRISGEPIAYLLGQREFYGLKLCVDENVLIPRPETELLVDIAKNLLATDKESQVLDLGTGSGAIAIAVATVCPKASVYAVDQSETALTIARHNAAQHGVEIHFFRGNWFDPIPNMKFDLILSNPPYIVKDDPHLSEGDLRFEPRAALTDNSPDGLTHLRHIIKYAPDYLLEGGQVWCEHGYDQAKACRTLLQAHGFIEVQSLPDLNGIERVSGGRWVSS